MDNSRYYNHYKRTDLGYKILDNGSCEGLPVSAETLMILAEQVQADEVVIPDTLGNMEITVRQARQFEPLAAPEYKYMAVLQGQTMPEILQCASQLSELSYINTFGIPKHLAATLDNLAARIQIAQHVQRNFAHEIHFLGMISSWPREIQALAHETTGRGIDSSLPIFAGLWGFDVARDNISRARRPENYFDMVVLGDEDREQVEANIRTAIAWANGAS